MDDSIQFDVRAGRFSGGNIKEKVGLFFLRLGARLTSPFLFFGYSYGARAVRLLLPSNASICVLVEPGIKFMFPYGDGYWGRLLDHGQPYARDLQDFLKAVKDCGHAFVDCGANFGYFSICMSHAQYGSCPTIAIEADQENFRILQDNQKLNDERFEIRHNAIFAKGGLKRSIYGKKHEAFSIVDDGGSTRGEVVTIALSELESWLSGTGKDRVIIKLDVEGAERDAIEGLGKLEDRDVLIIYEDHGSDRSHDNSRYLKDEKGYRIFNFSEGTAQEILDYHMLDAIKTNRRFGYDLLATKSAFWLEKIECMKVAS